MSKACTDALHILYNLSGGLESSNNYAPQETRKDEGMFTLELGVDIAKRIWV